MILAFLSLQKYYKTIQIQEILTKTYRHHKQFPSKKNTDRNFQKSTNKYSNQTSKVRFQATFQVFFDQPLTNPGSKKRS